MTKHTAFLWITISQVLILLALIFGNQAENITKEQGKILRSRQLVRSLELTDLSLWTEARYSRHPSQADMFSAFQDSPSSLDFFPAGLLIPPPHYNQGN